MNIKQLMKQAQQMQERMQHEIAALEVEGSAGGGMVTVKMAGSKQVLGVTIDPEVVDPQDVAMLQDLVLTAINDAGRRIDEAVQQKMGGLGLPGMF